MTEQQKQLHEEAVKEGKNWYFDPSIGKKVLTSLFLRRREYCCQSSCRHCPYGYNELTECQKKELRKYGEIRSTG